MRNLRKIAGQHVERVRAGVYEFTHGRFGVLSVRRVRGEWLAILERPFSCSLYRPGYEVAKGRTLRAAVWEAARA